MTDTDIALVPTDKNDDDAFSIWAGKLSIISFKDDPWRWNREWEKALRSLSSSKDVYPIMGRFYKKDVWDPTEFSQHSEHLKEKVCEVQNSVVRLWDNIEEHGHFDTAWLLLEEQERKRHLLKGMEEACQYSPLSQDSRALCPELTVSSMLAQRGRAFIDFIRTFRKGKRDVSENTPYILPSEWWEKAVDDIPQSPSEEFEESTFTLLTLHRNEFISQFFARAIMSVLHDLSHGSAGMDPVMDFIKAQGPFASAWSKTLSSVRDKPIIRCEHCTKTPEDIGRDVKFMLCSVCKSKLGFAVHYCSQACQKADWHKHKRHCGRSKVSKKLPGTAQDPFWACPELPEYLRHVPTSPDGDISMSSIGFPSPNSEREYSPALQRQVSLLTADKDADYYLYDSEGHLVRVELHDKWMKMIFRILRSDILSTSEQRGLETIAEYLIKVMGHKSGLSRERILEQLESEYGGDVTVATKVAEWERKAVENGLEGSTLLESMSRNLMATLPVSMAMGARFA